MFRNRACLFLTVISLALLVSPPAGAESLSRLLAPCLDNDTAAVIRIDMTALNTDALFDMVIQTASKTLNAEQVKRLGSFTQRTRSNMKESLTKFRAVGGKTLYAMLSVTDGMLLAAPVDKGVREEALKEWIETTAREIDSPCTTLAREGNLIIAGPSWVIERRKVKISVSRPELDKAAARAKPGAIQIFLIPTVDSRRVLEAMLPPMTGQKFQIPTNGLVNGLQWAAVSVNLPPRASVDVHVESGNADSARALQGVIAQAWQAVGQFAPIKAAYPELGKALARLTPQAKGDSLQLAFDTKQFTSLASEVITPGFFELRESILRSTCGETLNGMGKALLIYANDYEDQWPPSLQTLVEKAEYPRAGLTCPVMRHRPDYTSYVYRGVDTVGTFVEPSIIMVHDRAGNHPGGRNVLFVDSHVEWATEERFQELIEQDKSFRKVCGYGQVNENFLLRSLERAVTLISEGSLENKQHHFYEIPIPPEFTSGGKRRLREIVVALAYTPPVRSTRIKYRASRIDFRLVAASDLEHVTMMFNKATAKSNYKNIPELNGSYVGQQARSKGTVQADVWKFKSFDSRSPLRNKRLFVVVTRNDFPWGESLCGEEEDYSLVVSLRDQENQNARLYSQIKARIEARIPLRVRV